MHSSHSVLLQDSPMPCCVGRDSKKCSHNWDEFEIEWHDDRTDPFCVYFKSRATESFLSVRDSETEIWSRVTEGHGGNYCECVKKSTVKSHSSGDCNKDNRICWAGSFDVIKGKQASVKDNWERFRIHFVLSK
jgi:hypothetical protein